MAAVSPLLLESLRPLQRREYDRLVELGAFDDERVELLSGMLVKMSPQGAAHSSVVAELSPSTGSSTSPKASSRSIVIRTGIGMGTFAGTSHDESIALSAFPDVLIPVANFLPAQ